MAKNYYKDAKQIFEKIRKGTNGTNDNPVMYRQFINTFTISNGFTFKTSKRWVEQFFDLQMIKHDPNNYDILVEGECYEDF